MIEPIEETRKNSSFSFSLLPLYRLNLFSSRHTGPRVRQLRRSSNRSQWEEDRTSKKYSFSFRHNGPLRGCARKKGARERIARRKNITRRRHTKARCSSFAPLISALSASKNCASDQLSSSVTIDEGRGGGLLSLRSFPLPRARQSSR